jgi:hypothetical protein
MSKGGAACADMPGRTLAAAARHGAFAKPAGRQEVWWLGWRHRVRRSRDRQETMKRVSECVGAPELDLEILAWTRGAPSRSPASKAR